MELYELLEQVVLTFERLQIPYLITGSVASMAYGEPRLTNDIDLVAAIESKQIPELLAVFPPPSFYLSDEAIRTAITCQTQFNIIHPASGLKIDVMVRKDTNGERKRCQEPFPFVRARRLNYFRRRRRALTRLSERVDCFRLARMSFQNLGSV